MLIQKHQHSVSKQVLPISLYRIHSKSTPFYIFPLFLLIQKVLDKILEEQTWYILIIPFWSRQVWFQSLLSLSKCLYIYFSLAADFLHGSHMGPPWGEEAQVDSLAFEWYQFEFSNEVANVLLNAQRPSIRRSYLSKWNYFPNWTRVQGVHTENCPFALVIEYVLSLKESGQVFFP